MTIAFATVIILSALTPLLFGVDKAIIGWDIGIAVFAFAKIAMAMMFTQGWKVFGRKAIFGMPRLLFIIYVILGTLLFAMFMTTREFNADFHSSQMNFFSLIVSMTISVGATFIMWYAGVGEWMGVGSEYEARVQFKNKGYSEQEIESSVKLLRANGVIE
jgi:hypothetical protein